MWDPRRLTTLWAFTACYRDSFTHQIRQKAFYPNRPCLIPYFAMHRTPPVSGCRSSGVVRGPRVQLIDWRPANLTERFPRLSSVPPKYTTNLGKIVPFHIHIHPCFSNHHTIWNSLIRDAPISVAARSKAWTVLPRLKRWGRGFESDSRHGCLCPFILCLCCSVCR
jgi:hypothetical protein